MVIQYKNIHGDDDDNDDGDGDGDDGYNEDDDYVYDDIIYDISDSVQNLAAFLTASKLIILCFLHKREFEGLGYLNSLKHRPLDHCFSVVWFESHYGKS